MYWSRIHIDRKLLGISYLDYWLLMRTNKNKGKYESVIHKSGRGRLWERSLMRAFNNRV